MDMSLLSILLLIDFGALVKRAARNTCEPVFLRHGFAFLLSRDTEGAWRGLRAGAWRYLQESEEHFSAAAAHLYPY